MLRKKNHSRIACTHSLCAGMFDRMVTGKLNSCLGIDILYTGLPTVSW